MDRKSMVNIRGLSIIGVIIIHITADYIARDKLFSTSFFNILLNTASRFCVPVFFISSGYGINLRYKRNLDTQKFYLSRLKVIPDFIFWGIIFALISEYTFSFKEIIKTILGMSFYHLYFIPALLICYFLYPIIVKFLCSDKRIIFLICAGILLQTGYFLGIKLPFFQFYGYIIYFLLGIYLQNNPNYLNKLKNRSTFIYFLGAFLIFSLVVFEYFYSNRSLSIVISSLKPTVYIYTLGVILIFTKYFYKPNKLLSILDRNSMNIYYVHPIFLILITEILSYNEFDVRHNILSIVIKLVVVTALSLLTSLLINNIKNIGRNLVK